MYFFIFRLFPNDCNEIYCILGYTYVKLLNKFLKFGARAQYCHFHEGDNDIASRPRNKCENKYIVEIINCKLNVKVYK